MNTPHRSRSENKCTDNEHVFITLWHIGGTPVLVCECEELAVPEKEMLQMSFIVENE